MPLLINLTIFLNCQYIIRTCNGLNSKMSTFFRCLFNAVNSSDYSVIAITESWLESGVNNCELFDPNKFAVYRCDRDFINTNCSRGGGVMLAIDSSLCSADLKLKTTTQFRDLYFIDILGVQIKVEFYCYYIILIYIPPNTTLDCYDLVFEIITSI